MSDSKTEPPKVGSSNSSVTLNSEERPDLRNSVMGRLSASDSNSNKSSKGGTPFSSNSSTVSEAVTPPFEAKSFDASSLKNSMKQSFGNMFFPIVSDEIFQKSYITSQVIYDYGKLLTATDGILDSGLKLEKGILFLFHEKNSIEAKTNFWYLYGRVRSENYLSEIYCYERMRLCKLDPKFALDKLEAFNFSINPHYAIKSNFIVDTDEESELSNHEWYTQYNVELSKFKKLTENAVNISKLICFEKLQEAKEDKNNLTKFIKNETYNESFKSPIIIFNYMSKLNIFVYRRKTHFINFSKSLLILKKGKIYIIHHRKINQIPAKFLELAFNLESLYLYSREFIEIENNIGKEFEKYKFFSSYDIAESEKYFPSKVLFQEPSKIEAEITTNLSKMYEFAKNIS